MILTQAVEENINNIKPDPSLAILDNGVWVFVKAMERVQDSSIEV